MSATIRIAIAQLVLIVIALGAVMAEQPTEVYTFEDCTDISINVVTGHIAMSSYDGDTLIVEFKNELQKPDISVREVTCEDGMLSIVETVTENNPEGSSCWTIHVPRGGQLGSVDCLSSLGDIEMTEVIAIHLKAHAATKAINATSISADGIELSTSSGDIHVSNSQISQEATLTTSDGVISFVADSLPAKLDAASTFGRVVLTVPTLGEDFRMEISKNAGKGQVLMPFECTTTETKKIDKNDTYETDRCIVNRGSNKYDMRFIRLLTGEGTIEIDAGDEKK